MAHLTEMQELFDKADAAMAGINSAVAELDALESQRAMLLEAITGLINEADASLDMRPSFRRAIANAHTVANQVRYGRVVQMEN